MSLPHAVWPLLVHVLTSDVGLAALAAVVFYFILRPLLKRYGRGRDIILAANEAFNEVERWAQETGYKGDAKLYKFLKLLSDKVDGLTAEEAETARRLAQAWAANGSAPKTEGAQG